MNFENPGLYQIGLIVSNFCTADTLQYLVAIPGIKQIYPRVGTIQQKESTITVTGFGMDSIPFIVLHNEFGDYIEANQVIKVDSVNYRATFDFSEASITEYTLKAIINNGLDTLISPQSFNVLGDGNMPFDEWVQFELAGGEIFDGNVLVPETDDLYVFVKKVDRTGYSVAWRGEASVKLGDETLSTWTRAEDFMFKVNDPVSTVYSLEIKNDRNAPISGLAKVSYAPDWIKLNEWQKGDILRSYGFDWKYFDIGENTDSLFFKTEGYGLWSTLEVYYQDFVNPEKRWVFSNMGAGYAIQGSIAKPQAGRYFIKYKDSAFLLNTENGDQKREYLVYVGTVDAAIIPSEKKIINELSSYKIGAGIAEIKVKGFGFNSLDSIVIQNQKDNTVYGINSSFFNSSEIKILHDFSQLDFGDYKIGIFEDSILFHEKIFQIVEKTQPILQAEIISRDKFRTGRYQKFVVRVKNPGNTDKSFVSLYVSGIPIEAKVRFDSEINLIDQEYPLDSLNFYDIIDDEKVVPLLINNLLGGDYIDIEMSLYLTNLIDFDLIVTIDDIFDDKIDFLINSDLSNYISDSYEIDSLTSVLKELISQSANSRKNDLITDAIGSTFGHLFQKINFYSGSPISNECSKEIGKTFGSLIGTQLWESRDKLVDEALKFLFDDWADCISISANTIKENIWDPISRNRGNGFWNTSKKVFSQYDLYFNLANSTLSCANAILTTPITPTGFATRLAARGIAKTSGNTLYRITSKRKQIASRIEKYQLEISLADWIINDKNSTTKQVVDATQKAIDAFEIGWNGGLAIGLDCDQDYDKIIKKISSIGSVTPEDKYGPAGFDQGSDLAIENKKRFIPEGQLFEYKIDYWNKEDATAPAAEVFIRDTLDTNFDINTFNFTEIGFLRWKLPLDGGKYFNVTVDMRPDKNLLVNVEGTLDIDNRVVFWTHRSLDPETMELPDDPMAGYLPPIDSTGYNIGWVNFTISAIDTLGHNTVFKNQAHVNFDGVGPWGPAPPYGPYTNTFDLSAPSSNVKELPSRVGSIEFEVQWTGSDDGGGIAAYDIYVSKDSGESELWLASTSDTTALFLGEPDATYRFYSIAKDHAGNREGDKDVFEAETRVVIQSFAIEGIETTAPTCTGDDSGTAIVDVSSTNVTLEYSLNNSTFQDSNSFSGLAPGSYRVYVRDKANTENKLEEEFSIGQAINESPLIPIIIINGSPGISEELSLVSSSVTGNQWFKDGVEIPGATGQSIMVNEVGTYQVRVTGSGGCSSSSELTAITSSPEIRTMSINLFPNPANRSTNIRFGKEAYIDRVAIYSVTGVLLQDTQRMMSVTNIELDLTGLSVGTYVILVQGNGILERLRLIKN